MKTDTPRPILLKDYRPPNYLIDTVHLDVSLAPDAHAGARAAQDAGATRPSPATPARCGSTAR